MELFNLPFKLFSIANNIRKYIQATLGGFSFLARADCHFYLSKLKTFPAAGYSAKHLL